MKYESIIKMLTLEDKVSLLTSANPFVTGHAQAYNVPVCKLNTKLEELSGLSFEALKSSFDRVVMQKAGKILALYSKLGYELNIPGLTLNDEAIIEPDNYFSFACASEINTGVKDNGFFSCYLTYPEEMQKQYYFEKAFKESKPEAIRLINGCGLEFLNDCKYDGLIYNEVTTAEELIRGFNYGVLATKVEGFDPVEAFKKAIENFYKAKKSYQDEEITKAQYEELFRKGIATTPRKLEESIERLIEKMNYYDAKLNEEVSMDDDELLDVTYNQVIMLKNELESFPLDFDKKYAVFGSNLEAKYFEGVSFYDGLEEYGLKLTEIYKKESEFEYESENISGADSFLVFLDSQDGKIRENDLKLLDKLKELGKPIVSIMAKEGKTDFSFANKVDGLLITDKTKFMAKASLDIACGRKNTKAFMSYTVNEYPLGYGLSYSDFTYRKLDIDHKRISMTVSNTSVEDGTCLVTAYCLYPNGEKVMLGFKKANVSKNSEEKLEIPFDNLSFKSYLEDEKSYGIVEGDYKILIYDSNDLIFEYELKLDKFVDDPYIQNMLDYEGSDIENTVSEFSKSFDKDQFFKEKRGLSLPKKILISTFAMIYYDGLLGFFLYCNITNWNIPIITYVLLALIGVFDIFYVIYVIVVSVKAKKFKGDDASFEKLVERVNSYNEEYHESFVPIEEIDKIDEIIPEEPEEVIEEFVEEALVEEVEEVTEFNEGEFIAKESKVEFKKIIDTEELSNVFSEYMLANGVIIEPSSARLLFASLAANRMIFLENNSPLLPKLLEGLNSYLGNVDFFIEDCSEVKNSFDLSWDVENGYYVKSPFIKALAQAEANPDNISFVVLTGVNPLEMNDYLKEFIRYSKNPGKKYTFEYEGNGETIKIEIPSNFYIFVIPTEYNYLETVPFGLIDAATFYSISLRENNVETKFESEIDYLGMEALKDILSHDSEEQFLDEEYWKKIDDFEEELQKTCKFNITNKMVLSLEKLSTMLLSAEADMQEVLDGVLATKIIPLAKSLNVGDELKELYDRFFGELDLPRSSRAIRGQN